MIFSVQLSSVALTVLVSKCRSRLRGHRGVDSPLLACDELLCPWKAWLVCVTHPLFQIHIDIPRTNPLIPLFQQPLVQEVRGSEAPAPHLLWGMCVELDQHCH